MHPSSYFGIAAALLLGVFIFVFSSGTPAHRAAVVATESSSSTPKLLIVPGQNNAPITIQDLLPTLPSVATATPILPVPKPLAKKSVSAIATTPVSTPTVAPPVFVSSGNTSLDSVASSLRAALVNIVCYAPTGSGIKSISGSGIIIDSRGIILTNAHVAQYFLLADRGIACSVRVGSPAADAYRAKLMFISPAWLRANPTVLTATLPSGDGEHDYALLAIISSAGGTPLPTVFPSILFANLPPGPSTPVVIASYGAQFLESSQIQSDLFPTVVFGSVKQVYTFAVNSIDILALGGSVAAQEGSSGGGVADASGNLVGTITTSTVEGDTSTRNVNAITASYIRRAYIEETGSSLDTLFAETPANAVAAFAGHIPVLEALITANLR